MCFSASGSTRLGFILTRSDKRTWFYRQEPKLELLPLGVRASLETEAGLRSPPGGESERKDECFRKHVSVGLQDAVWRL